MAKKKTTKKKKVKLSADEKEELKAEGELPKKNVRESENIQLIWFFAVVIVIFAAFLVPYFWIESSKTFEWGGAEWQIEEYEYLEIYHGQFPALNGANIIYNVYLRNDPRIDNVYTEGNFYDFKYGGYLSWTGDIQECRGEVPRAALDLKSFIRTGVGIGEVNSGAAEEELAEELGFPYVNCFTNPESTVVMLMMGEPSVIQAKSNPNCYVVTIRDCDDIEPIEKFITKTIYDST